MISLLIAGTALALLGSGIFAYVRTKDPLFPLVILAPMLGYAYVYRPILLEQSGALEEILPDPGRLVMVHVLYFLGISAFCLGAVIRAKRIGQGRRLSVLDASPSPVLRTRVFQLVLIVGAIGAISFWVSVFYSGGPLVVFSRKKPVLQSPIPSGYFNELWLLCYPAILLLAATWQKERLHLGRIILFAVIASPPVIWGTLGGRRGPAFLACCTLFAAWSIFRNRLPTLRTILAGMVALGLLLLMLKVERSNLFKPWSADFEIASVTDSLTATDLNVGDEYVSGVASVLMSDKYDSHYWGWRYFVTIFIRPIPKQLWPTKYQDTGLGAMQSKPGKGDWTPEQWREAVGFVPLSGSSTGFVADLFQEFWWGALPGCFVVGWFLTSVWERWASRGGYWTILYSEVLLLSVYLPTQSLGAWLYRLVLLAVPTTILCFIAGVPFSRRRPSTRFDGRRPEPWQRPISGQH